MMNKRRHFHTFDAFRFIAFFLVFLLHAPLPDYPIFNFISKSGGIGVSFFFVLSGFLITYILLYEKETKGKISLKKFFVRRILRIWPLYYLMILFAFLTPYILQILNLPYSSEGYSPNWLVSSLFLENYHMMLTDSFPNTSPLRVMWSLCIEEHFYIVWGVIFYFFPIKKIPIFIVSSILLAPLLRIIYSYYSLSDLDLFTNIDYFAYGAIPAYCIIKKENIIKKINSISISKKIFIIFLTLSYVFISPNIQFPFQQFINPTIFGLLFSLLIFFIISPDKSIHIKDSNIISKLGVYTYGLYLYHTIIILLLIQVSKKLNVSVNEIYISLFSLIITILTSMVSYHIFESKFIKVKKYFY